MNYFLHKAGIQFFQRHKMTSSKCSIPVSCNKDCGGGCPLIAEVEGGKLLKIKNSPHRNRYINGCVRGIGMTKAVCHEKRVLTPLKRVGERGDGRFESISWEQALSEVAEKLKNIQLQYGSESVFTAGGSGSCRGVVHNTSKLSQRFFALFGGYTGSLDTFSDAAFDFAAPYVIGNSPSGFDPVHFSKARQIILWGANIVDNVFGAETPGYLREAKKNGIPIIVIDPRETNTVKQLATQWISILPGTDAVLMTALLYEIITRFKPSNEYIFKYSIGYQELENYILGKSDGILKDPDWAEKKCGVPANVIRQLATDYAEISPTAMIPGLSYQRTVGGEEAVRLGIILQFLTQNFGVVGGSSGSKFWGAVPSPQIDKIPAMTNPKGCNINVYQWADAALGGKAEGFPSDIKCIYTIGGNFMVQGSDIQKNIDAFKAMDLVVTHDYFMTDTAKHSDYVLPTTLFLEREDVVFTSANYLLYSAKAIEPPENVKTDYEILYELAVHLGFENMFSEGRSADQWLDKLIEKSEIDDVVGFKSTGIHYGKYNQGFVAFSEFMKNPKEHPLDTPSGKIEIYSEEYEALGFPGIPKVRPMSDDDTFPFYLITPHHRSHTHSQMITERTQMVWINSRDAKDLKVENEEKVIVASNVGRILVPAFVTDQICPGVVALEEGIWPAIDPKTGIPSGAANWLSSTVPTLPSHGSRTHSQRVKISKVIDE